MSNTKLEFAKEMRETIYSKLLLLSFDLQCSKRYEKANQQGAYYALLEVWKELGKEIDILEYKPTVDEDDPNQLKLEL